MQITKFENSNINMLSEQLRKRFILLQGRGSLLPKEGIMMSNNHVQQNENQIDDNQKEQRKDENSSTRRVPFTSEEDQLLLDLYERYGK